MKIEPPEMTISSDAAGGPQEGMKSCYPRNDNWRGLDPSRKEAPYQHTRNDGSRNGHQNIYKGKIVKSMHLQVDNLTALYHILKMGGTKNMTLIEVTKRIWEYLLSNGITLTVEYIPSKRNKSADWESRNTQDSREWKLEPAIFQKFCHTLGKPQIDIFASRMSHQT